MENNGINPNVADDSMAITSPLMLLISKNVYAKIHKKRPETRAFSTHT
jgi:hypothetical protein